MKGLKSFVGNYLMVEPIDVKTKIEKKGSDIIIMREGNKKDGDGNSYDEHPFQGKVCMLGSKYEGEVEVGDRVAIRADRMGQVYGENFIFNDKLYLRILPNDILAVYEV